MGVSVFWITVVAFGGGIYAVTARRSMAGPVLVVLGIAIALAYPLLAIVWIDGKLGINTVMVHSFQLFSGVHDPNDIVTKCPENQTTTTSHALVGLVIMLVVLIIALGNALVGLVALVALPVGVVGSFVGSLITLFTHLRNRDVLIVGSAALGIGAGAVIAAGLVMRLMHVVSSFAC